MNNAQNPIEYSFNKAKKIENEEFFQKSNSKKYLELIESGLKYKRRKE